MRMDSGAKVGPYQVVSLLGRGGMGEVYRARDVKLDRDVAIKVLPEMMAHDKERLLRFQREAKLLASLNHPGVAQIYGFEESAGSSFLVLEYVEGETLSSRLKRGALPLDEALEAARQIAEALEAAHKKGVIHRDLKPGNVMIRPDGAVKVLDFGLARAMQNDSAETNAAQDSPTVVAHSPTITADYTQPGVVLGTAPYMSPEQARGRPMDKQSDIWSFGCVLYECLTGLMLFRGETASDSLGAIMHREPDWNALPPGTPPTIQLVLRRCLAKDRKKRLHDISDARIEIEATLADPTNSSMGIEAASLTGRASRGAKVGTIAAILIFATFAAIATWNLKPTPAPTPPAELRKLEIQVDGLRRDEGYSPVISPDGRRILYSSKGSLWVRSLSDVNAIELSGTTGANLPFWSPDSTQVGFHDGSRLWRMPAVGGARAMICVTPRMLESAGGVAWMRDGRVIFTAAWGGPFWEVPASGGEPRAMFTGDPDRVQDFHNASALPDGSGVLSVLHRVGGEPDSIVLVRNDTFELVIEHPNEKILEPVYAKGHILYGRVQTTGTIWAAPFSLETHQITGPSFLVAESAEIPSASTDGTLVYASSTYGSVGQLVWVDQKGVITEVVGLPQQGIDQPVLSPDDARVAAFANEAGTPQIWVYELASGTGRPLTVEKGASWISGWLTNTRLAYSARRKTYARLVVGSDPPEVLIDWDSTTISPDHRYMAVERRVDKSFDIFYHDLQEGGAGRPLLTTRATEQEPTFRPGGNWLAYVSDETGRDEVYLTKFPSGDGKWQVSFSGGTTPRWNQRGNELFYDSDRTDNADVMCVGVTTEPGLKLTKPRKLFSGSDVEISLRRGWSVSSDGNRILGVRDLTPKLESGRITVVENWYREFEK